jgi:ketosteroid isomerase-like protein
MSESEKDAVLAANLAFYQAFTSHDVAAMEAIWARHAPVACTHPGWVALQGRGVVMESWRSILQNPEAPHVMCHDDTVFFHGDVALVLCEEELAQGHLSATNVFVKEDGQWRLVHHQASPLFARGSPAAPR